MKENIRELIDKYQVRKSFKEKTEFINWLDKKVEKLDFKLEVDQYSKDGRNLIIGDVEKAEIILTAHYDTQPNFFMPMFMGMNWLGLVLSQICMMVMMLAVPFLIYIGLSNIMNSLIAYLIGFIVFVVIMVNMYVGVANKHTVNDNTSGVATLMSIMEDLPTEERNKVCFVFFDQEELGLIGSSKFKSKYLLVLKNKPLINFDCVANGKNIVYICKKEFRESKYIEILEKSVENNKREDKDYLIGSAIKYVYPSDQIHFKSGVGVAALKKAPILGYYLNGIHNSRDKIFMEENVENIKETMIYFIQNI